MTDKTWKAVERAIAKFFPGAKRRGADFGGTDGGKSDIIFPGWSIEVKHRTKVPNLTLIAAAIQQAEDAREQPTDIPIAIIHLAGTEYKNSVVCMRLETFADFFVNNPTQ